MRTAQIIEDDTLVCRQGDQEWTLFIQLPPKLSSNIPAWPGTHSENQGLIPPPIKKPNCESPSQPNIEDHDRISAARHSALRVNLGFPVLGLFTPRNTGLSKSLSSCSYTGLFGDGWVLVDEDRVVLRGRKSLYYFIRFIFCGAYLMQNLINNLPPAFFDALGATESEKIFRVLPSPNVSVNKLNVEIGVEDLSDNFEERIVLRFLDSTSALRFTQLISGKQNLET